LYERIPAKPVLFFSFYIENTRPTTQKAQGNQYVGFDIPLKGGRWQFDKDWLWLWHKFEWMSALPFFLHFCGRFACSVGGF
jgi:hypothetical protein